MPLPYKTYIDNAYAQAGSCYTDWYNAGNNLTNAGDQIFANNWANARDQLHIAGQRMRDAAVHFGQDSFWGHGFRAYWYDACNWINDNWPSGATVDMDAILNAMLAATFEQLKSFVGITDAYRTAIWEAPFNQEYYAALARGFREWGLL